MTAIRLLIIEDSATVRAVIEQIVEQEPHASVVGVAGSAESARVLLDTAKPNIITLDLHMPGIGGMAFLSELHGMRRAPVVVVSSATIAGSTDAEEVVKRGAAGWFDKHRIIAEAKQFRALLRRTIDKREKALLKGAYI